MVKKTFMEFASPYLLEEGLKDITAGLAAKLQSAYQNKVGYVLAKWPGLDHFVNNHGNQTGIKFFLSTTGKAVRFNVGEDGDVYSVDVWDGENKTPVAHIANLTTNLVIKAAAQIAAVIKNPKALIGKALNLPIFEHTTTPIEEMAQAIEWNGATYPSKTKAIEAALLAGHSSKDIQAMFGVQGPQVHAVKTRLSLAGGPGQTVVVAGSPEQATDPSVMKANALISRVKYADPETVFKDVIRMVDMVAMGINNSCIICGEKGIGKTTEVINRLKELVDSGRLRGEDIAYSSGARVTEKGLYEYLFNNFDKLIVFDDSDSVFKSDDKVNMLKAALDTRDPRQISWHAASLFDPNTVSTEEYESLIEQGKLPNKFPFTGRVIFISNLTLEKFDDAIRSRSFVFDIRLKLEDKWKIIESKLSVLCSDVPEVTDEDRKIAFDIMKEDYQGHNEVDLRSLVKAIKLVHTFRVMGDTDENSLRRMIQTNL